MSNFIIRDSTDLKKKAALVEELIGIQKAIVGTRTRSGKKKEEEKKQDKKPNQIDAVYDTLNAKIVPLPEKSDEY